MTSVPSLTYVNQPIHRVDAALKVAGAVDYTGDMKLKGMLHAAVLRSPHAHALIRHIDTRAAAAVPGVRAVVSGRDFPQHMGINIKDQAFFATDRVRFFGEPVAAVAAVDAATAEQARDLIQVEYEPLPVVLDATIARASATLVHPELMAYERERQLRPLAGTNVFHLTKLRKGDVAAGFAAADRVFEETYSTPTQQHVPLESRAIIAQADRQGGLTLWVCTQSPFVTRKMLSDSLGLPQNQIRVIVPWVGGGFGSKLYISFEQIGAALALRTGGAPVRLACDREEEFLTFTRHGVTVRLKTGVQADGTLVAQQAEVVLDGGAYADCSPRVADHIATHFTGPYRIPNVHIDVYAVYTNKVPATAFRGYGMPKGVWAQESQMDVIAAALGQDPVALRRRNLFREGDETSTGQKLVAVGARETLDAVVQRLGPAPPPGPSHRKRGQGLAVIHKAVTSPSSSGAIVAFHADGTVTVQTGIVDMGQGAGTILTQIVAEELSVPVARIQIMPPDTQISPMDRSTSGSRGTLHGGQAMRLACADLIQQLQAVAGDLWEVAPHDVDYVAGRLQVRGYPERSQPADQVVRARLGGFGGALIGRADFAVHMNKQVDPETSQGFESVCWMYATHGAEVEVDTETGLVRVLRVVAAHDVGQAINPVACQQQIEGGVLMGVGGALTEELQFDALGRPLNLSLVDYKLQTAMDAPEIDAVVVEVPHPLGPFGAKGLGEPALAPTAAAIANAIYAAIGVRIRHLPITPERVLAALADRQTGAGDG